MDQDDQLQDPLDEVDENDPVSSPSPPPANKESLAAEAQLAKDIEAAADRPNSNNNMQDQDDDANFDPSRKPKVGGWGSETSGGGGGGGGGTSTSHVNESVSKIDETSTSSAQASNAPAHGRRKGGPQTQQKDKFETDVITDITEIPDVEEEVRDDITSQIADAPNVRSHRVQNLQELDAAFQFALPSTQDGIDLTSLITALAPQEKVMEADAPWEWDVMFTEVSSEMQAELDNSDKEEGDKGDDKDDRDNAKRTNDEDDKQPQIDSTDESKAED